MEAAYILGIAYIILGIVFLLGWWKLRRMKSYLLISVTCIGLGIMACITRHIWSNPETISWIRSWFNIAVGLAFVLFFIEETIRLKGNSKENNSG